MHVRDLSKRLLEDGHEVMVVVGGEGPFTNALRAAGVEYRPLRFLVRPIRPARDLAAFWELRRALLEWRPDVVAAHSSKAGVLARLAARSVGVPVVYTAHGWSFTEGIPELQRRLFAVVERMVGPLADCIIVVSEYDRQLAIAHGIAPRDRVVVVHNGVPDVPQGHRARPAVHPPRLIMVARFEPQKDHMTLLRALAGLRDLEWELELVGNGPTLEAVRAEARRLDMLRRIRFMGVRHDVADRLVAAQVFVLTSRWEGFPLSVLEAMRAGLPVVASDVGGVREAVAHGRSGFVVPRGDADALRATLVPLLMQPQLRDRMGAEGRKRYESYFTFERMYRNTLQIYQRVSRM